MTPWDNLCAAILLGNDYTLLEDITNNTNTLTVGGSDAAIDLGGFTLTMTGVTIDVATFMLTIQGSGTLVLATSLAVTKDAGSPGRLVVTVPNVTQGCSIPISGVDSWSGVAFASNAVGTDLFAITSTAAGTNTPTFTNNTVTLTSTAAASVVKITGNSIPSFADTSIAQASGGTANYCMHITGRTADLSIGNFNYGSSAYYNTQYFYWNSLTNQTFTSTRYYVAIGLIGSDLNTTRSTSDSLKVASGAKLRYIPLAFGTDPTVARVITLTLAASVNDYFDTNTLTTSVIRAGNDQFGVLEEDTDGVLTFTQSPGFSRNRNVSFYYNDMSTILWAGTTASTLAFTTAGDYVMPKTITYTVTEGDTQTFGFSGGSGTIALNEASQTSQSTILAFTIKNILPVTIYHSIEGFATQLPCEFSSDNVTFAQVAEPGDLYIHSAETLNSTYYIRAIADSIQYVPDGTITVKYKPINSGKTMINDYISQEVTYTDNDGPNVVVATTEGGTYANHATGDPNTVICGADAVAATFELSTAAATYATASRMYRDFDFWLKLGMESLNTAGVNTAATLAFAVTDFDGGTKAFVTHVKAGSSIGAYAAAQFSSPTTTIIFPASANITAQHIYARMFFDGDASGEMTTAAYGNKSFKVAISTTVNAWVYAENGALVKDTAFATCYIKGIIIQPKVIMVKYSDVYAQTGSVAISTGEQTTVSWNYCVPYNAASDLVIASAVTEDETTYDASDAIILGAVTITTGTATVARNITATQMYQTNKVYGSRSYTITPTLTTFTAATVGLTVTETDTRAMRLFVDGTERLKITDNASPNTSQVAAITTDGTLNGTGVITANHLNPAVAGYIILGTRPVTRDVDPEDAVFTLSVNNGAKLSPTIGGAQTETLAMTIPDSTAYATPGDAAHIFYVYLDGATASPVTLSVSTAYTFSGAGKFDYQTFQLGSTNVCTFTVSGPLAYDLTSTFDTVRIGSWRLHVDANNHCLVQFRDPSGGEWATSHTYTDDVG